MLYTNLKHIETAADYAQIVGENDHVMIVCGSMGPMCIPVYSIAEILQAKHPHVKFYDMEFDNPESQVIRTLPEVRGLIGIPFTLYYKNEKVVKVTSGVQTLKQVNAILEKEFTGTVSILKHIK